MVRNRRRLDVSSKQQRPRHGGAYCADLVLHARVLSVLSMLAVGLPSCGVSTGGGNNYPKVVRVPVLPRTTHLSFQYPRDSRGLSHFSFSYPGDSRGLSHFSFWYPRDSRGLSHFSFQYPRDSRELKSFQLLVPWGLARTQTFSSWYLGESRELNSCQLSVP